MKVKIISNRLGICPYCNSENISYDTIKFEDDHIYYPCNCNTCGKYFQEWYYLDFVGHNVGAFGQYEASDYIDKKIEYSED